VAVALFRIARRLIPTASSTEAPFRLLIFQIYDGCKPRRPHKSLKKIIANLLRTSTRRRPAMQNDFSAG
jgi:hypothetical protein